VGRILFLGRKTAVWWLLGIIGGVAQRPLPESQPDCDYSGLNASYLMPCLLTEVQRGIRMKTPQALIVEDVSELSDIFAEAISAAGYEVSCLSDGLVAHTYLQDNTPDLLVLDIHLPGLKGDSLLQQTQLDGRFAQTKYIIVTADAYRGEALRELADLVLLKPVSYRQLRDLSGRLATVMDHLQTSPIIRQ
jgi:CheY-like chemotaxis protein